MPPVTPAILVQNLVKRYAGRAVVDGISFDVAPGEVFAILGPNGAGKTTTVEILEGYRAPDAGSTRVLGLDPQRDGAALKPRVGLMLQGGGVYPQARPLEALRLFASFFAHPLPPEHLLQRVGLERAAGTRYRRLSGGEKQRLSLALALVGRPELVFLDEPTAAMDPEARQATWEIIRGLKAQGVTVVLTTHFMDEAERLADRVAIINRGRLIALGAPAELVARQAQDLRFTTEPSVPNVDTAGLAMALGGHTVQDLGNGRYLVQTPATPRIVSCLAAWLAEHGVLLRELRTGGGSLEEVYLRLTRDGERADHIVDRVPDGAQ